MLSKKVSNALEELLNESSGEEPQRQPLVRNLLSANEWDVEMQYPIRSYSGNFPGKVDIFLPGRRVFIEIKSSTRAMDPFRSGTGSKKGESAFDQVKRYVLDERRREMNELRFDEEIYESVPWIGAVTDGRIWWIWEWNFGSTQERSLVGERPIHLDNLLDLEPLLAHFDKTAGKRWAPSDPSTLFTSTFDHLDELYDAQRTDITTETQFALWKNQLRLAGQEPIDSDAHELFKCHTLLIAIARTIGVTLGADADRKSEGFISWSSAEESGRIWWQDLEDLVSQFRWNVRPTDVLRPVFQHYIQPRHRKSYGEYYTPDWIAEAIVQKVIDERWIKSKISATEDGDFRGHGILDPACGSGTFLYHAARRIIQSEALKNESFDRHEASDFATQLIHGFDIHPVAVEMSRTTVARALPTYPRKPIQIGQCDSLLTNRAKKDELANMEFSVDGLRIRSPLNQEFVVPRSFLMQSGFQSDLRKLVSSASLGRSLPNVISRKFKGEELVHLKRCHEKLRDVITQEGNSVWAWYIFNQAQAPVLSERKVDRIIANPPWVRVSNIQDRQRKDEIEKLASDKNLWVGGKNATGFDIAALFADHCPDLYLKGNGKCAWLLPQAAMRGGNWEGFRNQNDIHLNELWDVHTLPFPKQSKSCVRFENRSRAARNASHRYARYGIRGAIPSYETWDTVTEFLEFEEIPKPFDKINSEWLHDDRSPIAKQGATLVPHCLVRISTSEPLMRHSMKIETSKSRHLPWSRLGVKSGTVPNRWVNSAVFSTDLVPFFVSSEKSRVLIPLKSNGVDFDTKRDDARWCWKSFDYQYQKNRGKGTSTPKNLLDQIDFQGKLTSQIRRNQNKFMVVYVTSGANMAAVACKSNHIVESSLYWVSCVSKQESHFLAAILNSDALARALRESRKSDRHFHTHLWYEIPIPRFNTNNPIHKNLAEQSVLAHKVVARFHKLQGMKNRDEIRNVLREASIMPRIDELVRKLLPHHTTRGQ